MNKKKAFTLIELLAVIIILAVISLVAVPKVIDIIKEAQDSARRSSISGFADAVKFAVVGKNFDNDFSYSEVNPVWVYGVEKNVLYSGNEVICSEISYDNKGAYLNDCQVGEYVDDKYCYINNMIYSGEECPTTDDDYDPGLATPEACFTFDFNTKTITHYDEVCGGTSVIIPRFFTNTNGYKVAVENIGTAAFTNANEIYVGYEITDTPFCQSIGSCYFELPLSIAVANNITFDYVWGAVIDFENKPTKFCNETNIDGEEIEVDYNSVIDETAGYSSCYFAYREYISSSGHLTDVDFSQAKYLKSIGDVSFASNQIVNSNFSNLNNLESIGASAFAFNLMQLVNINSSPNFKKIGIDAFSNNQIINFNFSNLNNLESIGSYSLSWNQITDVNFENLNNLKSIGKSSFLSNPIENIDFSNLNKLESIGNYAFGENYLNQVTLPHSNILTNIGNSTFCKSSWQNSSLSVIYNYTENSFDWYGIVNGISDVPFEIGTVINKNGNVDITDGTCFAFDESTKTITGYISSCGTDVVIPNEIDNIAVEHIGNYAFDLMGLTSVDFSQTTNLKTIGTNAFLENQLVDVNLSNSNNLTSIYFGAFANNMIASLSLPSSLINLGNEGYNLDLDVYAGAFSNNQLSNIDLSSLTNLKEIGVSSFEHNQLTSLDLTSSINLLEIADGSFTSNLITSINLPSQLTIIGSETPLDSLDLYAGVFANNQIQDINLSSLSNLKTIGNSAFLQNVIQSLDLSSLSNLTTIRDGAFSTNNISNLQLPNSLITIGSKLIAEEYKNATVFGAFSGNQIQNLNLETNLIQIGSFSFLNNQIQNLDLSKASSLITIEEGAFNNNQIQNINLNGLTSLIGIGESSFFNNQISSIDLSNLNNVEYVGANSFYGNILSEVKLTKNSILNTIGNSAFYKDGSSNQNLTNIYNYTENSFDWYDIINNTTAVAFVDGLLTNSYGDVLISDGTCFAFDKNTKTITAYKSYCGQEAIIPKEINGVTVENIADNALASYNLNSIDFRQAEGLKTINSNAFLKSSTSNSSLERIYTTGDLYNWSGITSSTTTNQLFRTGTIIHQDGNIEVIGLKKCVVTDYALGERIQVEVKPGTKNIFYVMDNVCDDDQTVTAILDRNLGNPVKWSYYDPYQGEIRTDSNPTAGQYLKDQTQAWSNLEDNTFNTSGVTYSDPGCCQTSTINYGQVEIANSKAVLLPIEEFEKIGCVLGEPGSCPSWLTDNIICDNVSCSINGTTGYNEGFYTNTNVNSSSQAFVISGNDDGNGNLTKKLQSGGDYSDGFYNTFGVRPVIKVKRDFVQRLNYSNGCFLFDSSTGTISGYNTNCLKDVIIPESINGVNVLYIADFAFNGLSLTSVDLRNASYLQTIGLSSFTNNQLLNIYIDGLQNLTSIGNYAFSGNQISSLNLSNLTHLKTIGDNAFLGNQISDVNLTNDSLIEVIGKSAFLSNQIINLSFPDNNSLTIIDEYAFAQNPLQSVNLSVNHSLQSIKNYAFSNGNLSNLNLSGLSSLTTIGDSAFTTNEIVEINLAGLSNLTYLGREAFYQNKIENLDISALSSLITIEDGAFASNNISGISFPQNLQYIGSQTSNNIYFNACYDIGYTFASNQISNISLPTSLKKICSNTFGNNFIAGNLDLSNLVNLEYLAGFQNNQITNLNLSGLSNVQIIGKTAFQNNQISSINFGSTGSLTNLTAIYSDAFNKNQLTSVENLKNIPNLSYIDSYSFANNQISGTLSLTGMPNFRNMGYYAFYNNLISEVYLGADLTNLNHYTTCPTGYSCYDTYEPFGNRSLAGNNIGIIYDFTGHQNNYVTGLGGRYVSPNYLDDKGRIVIIATSLPYNVSYDSGIVSLTGNKYNGKFFPNQVITLTSTNPSRTVAGFKLNGVSSTGKTFAMPSQDSVISDIVYGEFSLSYDSAIVTPSENNGGYVAPGHTVSLISVNTLKKVSEFKLNGNTITGNIFTMPGYDSVISDVVLIDAPVPIVLESSHSYSNSMNTTYTKTISGASSLSVYFNSSTYVETNYDFIYIYTGSDVLVGKYTGTTLANKTINVSGNTVKIKLTSDSSVTGYGFNAAISGQ